MTWSRAIGSGLLALAAHGVASAEQPAIASLLKPLDLRGYPAGVRPPHFTAPTLDDRTLDLAGLRGRVVILNFWASWCLECRPELPVFEQLHRELGPRGLVVIGVNNREDSTTVRRYAGELGLSFPIVLDPDGKVNALYGVIGLPSTFLLGRDGRAVALAVGPREWAGASGRAIFDAMLAEPMPAPARETR